MATTSHNLRLMFERSNVYPYPWYIADLVATKDMAQLAEGLVLKESFVVIRKDFFKLYYDVPSAVALGNYSLKRVINDVSFYKTVIRELRRHSGELLAFCEGVSHKDLKSPSNQELADMYSEYIDRLRGMRLWGWVMPFLDGVVEEVSMSDFILEKLRAHLAAQGKTDEAAHYYSLLSSSEKKSAVQTEEIARLKLLDKLLQSKDAADIKADIEAGRHTGFIDQYPKEGKLVTAHLQKFNWLTYAYVGPIMQIEHLFPLLKENLKGGDPQKQLQLIEDHYGSIKQRKKELTHELKLPKDLQYLLRLSSELMYIKDYRKGVYQKSYVLMDIVLEEIAQRVGLSMKELKYLVETEVQEMLRAGRDYKNVINQRLELCCLHIHNGLVEVWEGAKAEAMIDEFIGNEDIPSTDIQELKGMPAYTGKVTGVVRVVLVASDVAKFNEGEILVSSATNPDLVLAMKKAAAIVTDTGGITSHAAIVSREMKKPCVVGTRIATRVLKDGDMVEVDAYTGIVKKI